MSSEKQSIKRQGLFYLLVGSSSALLELLLFQLLYIYIFFNIAPSNIIAVVVATIFNFALNRGVTFQSSSNIVRSLALYLLLFLCNLGFSTLVIQILVQHGIHSAAAKLLTQVCIVVWNFFIYRHIIFK